MREGEFAADVLALVSGIFSRENFMIISHIGHKMIYSWKKCASFLLLCFKVFGKITLKN